MRAKLFNKRGLTKSYGTPTPVNPILPMPSPVQQEIDDLEEEPKPQPVAAAAETDPEIEPIRAPTKHMPGQPGNPPGNAASNGPQTQSQAPIGTGKAIAPPQPRMPGQIPHANEPYRGPVRASLFRKKIRGADKAEKDTTPGRSLERLSPGAALKKSLEDYDKTKNILFDRGELFFAKPPKSGSTEAVGPEASEQ